MAAGTPVSCSVSFFWPHLPHADSLKNLPDILVGYTGQVTAIFILQLMVTIGPGAFVDVIFPMISLKNNKVKAGKPERPALAGNRKRVFR